SSMKCFLEKIFFHCRFLHSQALQYLMDPERFKWKQLIFVSQGMKCPVLVGFFEAEYAKY
ncbi:hypothetical protein S83_023477, partial [Arachis hypogaea]